MLRQIELLLRVQTCNLFGMNEARYGKKGRQRGARIALMFAMALVTLVLCGYVAGLCYALCVIGAGESIPMLLAEMAAEKSASGTACPSPAAFARAFETADCSSRLKMYLAMLYPPDA